MELSFIYRRYLLLSLFVVLITNCSVFGQKKMQMGLSGLPTCIDTVTGEWKYIYVGEVSNAKADLLFERAKSWIVNSFKSAKAVIDYEDRISGVIVAKPIISVPIKSRGLLGISQESYKMVVDIRVKEGRYRCELQILEGVPSDTERRISPSVGNYPIQFTTQAYIKRIRSKGFMYAEHYDEVINLDKQFRKILSTVDNAMSTPSKSEF